MTVSAKMLNRFINQSQLSFRQLRFKGIG
ncbi:protein of unknown function [Pararobbsia alpina]